MHVVLKLGGMEAKTRASAKVHFSLTQAQHGVRGHRSNCRKDLGLDLPLSLPLVSTLRLPAAVLRQGTTVSKC